MTELDKIPMVELFGQLIWHSDGAIRLNRSAASALIAGLQAFLEAGNQTITVTASDGEGYHLHLIMGGLHDNFSANHYLDAPGLTAGCGDTLHYKTKQQS